MGDIGPESLGDIIGIRNALRNGRIASPVCLRAPAPRDAHISTIAERGRMAWQKTTGYGRRNLAETAIGRYKALIGLRLRARNWRAQKAETAIAVSVLDRILTAKPVCVRVA